MAVIAWIVEGTWAACVDAVKAHTSEADEVVLLHVDTPDVPGAAHGVFAGLLGRGHPERDPGTALERLSAASADRLLAAAAERLGRPCARERRTGRVEREVVAAAEGADLLVVARDGDRTRLGPRSLAPAARFVVDHAPCPVLLVWPEAAPDTATVPPPPPHPPEPPHPPGPHGHREPPPPPPPHPHGHREPPPPPPPPGRG
jgi:nucleotide-binding universal stress UspA family protein